MKLFQIGPTIGDETAVIELPSGAKRLEISDYLTARVSEVTPPYVASSTMLCWLFLNMTEVS